jgi:hypothetical protein
MVYSFLAFVATVLLSEKHNFGGGALLAIFFGFLLLICLGGQVLHAIWPLRVTRKGSRFGGIYWLWRIRINTGNVLGAGSDSHSTTYSRPDRINVTVGPSGYVSGEIHKGGPAITLSAGQTTLRLDERAGEPRTYVAVNVFPDVRPGDVVSVATVSHLWRRGNTFMVVNHTRRAYWIEQWQTWKKGDGRANEQAKRGIAWMVEPMPQGVRTFLGALLLPLFILLPLNAAVTGQLALFRRFGCKRLVAAMNMHAQQFGNAPEGH